MNEKCDRVVFNNLFEPTIDENARVLNSQISEWSLARKSNIFGRHGQFNVC